MLTANDTGILLRLLDRTDSNHGAIRQALRLLRARGDEPVTSPQNVAEFWAVCTRPMAARGGFGLSVQETERRVRLLERLFRVLPDSSAGYQVWRRLVVQYGVHGVQAHDARVVAWMQTYGITQLLTLNVSDFARYPGITASTPQDILSP
jgi:predicted nucleic acid-binding protein